MNAVSDYDIFSPIAFPFIGALLGYTPFIYLSIFCAAMLIVFIVLEHIYHKLECDIDMLRGSFQWIK